MITLKNSGASVLSFKTFSNHKPFKIAALKKLISEAKLNRALLVTTEKDFVKIPKDLQSNFEALTVDLELSNKKLVLEKLTEVF